MPRLPESPRTRRRLLYACVVLTVLIILAVLQAAIGGRSGPTMTKVRPGAVQRYVTPPSVKPTEEALAAAKQTLDAFVPSAVIRRHLARSWPLATPHMKEDTSRADWLAGNLPVVPYPAGQYRTQSYRLRYSYAGILGFDVLVLPRHTNGPQQVYSCELHQVRGAWLVDFCVPRKTL